ncbi:MAG: ATP-binding protein, partial [Candidatus Aminicenantia bacterium]
SLFYVQKRIKEEHLSNYRTYQELLTEHFKDELGNYLKGRIMGINVLSSLDSVKGGDILRMPKDIEDYFKYLRKLYGKAVFLYDENGIILYSTRKSLIGNQHSDREFFKWCLEERNAGKILISTLLKEGQKTFLELNPSPSDIFIVSPLYIYKKERRIFHGALGILINMRKYVESKLIPISTKRAFELSIFWKDGTLLYSLHHPEMVERNVFDKSCNKCHNLLPLQRALREELGYFEFYSGKTRSLANSVTLQLNDYSFKIMVRTPSHRIMALIHRSLLATILLTISIIFAFSISFVLFTRARVQKLRSDEKVETLREKLELEERLRKSEEKFSKFAENTSVGIWNYKTDVPIPTNILVEEQVEMILKHGYLAFCNDAMARMYGLERKEQFIGTFLKETLNPDDYRNVEFLKEFVKNGYKLINWESYEKDIHGKTHIFLNSLYGVIKNNHLIEAWGSQIDITELKELEEERRRLEQQLFQTHKMEALGRLTGGVAHDFNNILTAIIGNAELALSSISSTDPNYKRIISILESAKRASNLTRNLLTISRRQIGEFSVVNLNDIVNSMEDLLKRTAGEAVRFVLSLDPRLEPVEIETTQMEQVILNLAVNARDAMPEGGTITISTRNVILTKELCLLCSEYLQGEFVELSISDTGVGIPEEIREKIFEPFFSTKEGGTGLGLSIVYGALIQMRGHLTISSSPMKGTTFYIYLPIYKGTKREIKTFKFGDEEVKGGNETILLVEDEKDIVEMMTDFLSNLGYYVIPTSSAEEALEKIKGIDKIELLITDVILPKMKGRELSIEIKKRFPQAKTLFISGYPEERISLQEVAEGRVNFLPKPFTPFAIAKKIREILEQE